MSRLSIYETRWIDLVFENRNKEYGAYQLRRDSVKSSLSALFMGFLLVASLAGITSIANFLVLKPKLN
jgi:protein TonB